MPSNLPVSSLIISFEATAVTKYFSGGRLHRPRQSPHKKNYSSDSQWLAGLPGSFHVTYDGSPAGVANRVGTKSGSGKDKSGGSWRSAGGRQAEAERGEA